MIKKTSIKKLWVVTLLVMFLSGCGKISPTSNVSWLYNKWNGYCYVYPGQVIDSRFALVSKNIKYMFTAKTESPVILKSFNVTGDQTDPWRVIHIGWCLDQQGTTNLSPLRVTLSQGERKTLTTLALGYWHITVIHKSRTPFRVTNQSLGEVLSTIPSSYQFSVTLKSDQPMKVQDVSVISNADPRVLSIKLTKVTINGCVINAQGIVVLRNRSRQIYLIPAISYNVGQNKFIQPLLPIVFAVLPSADTERQYAQPVSGL